MVPTSFEPVYYGQTILRAFLEEKGAIYIGFQIPW